MAGWLNWREIEKHNDWGYRDKDDATAARWDDAAEGWNKRCQKEIDFTQRQVDLMDQIGPEDRVLDICCGPGMLSVPIAAKAKWVTGLDFGSEMLRLFRENTANAGAANTDIIQCNWNTARPGIDFPKYDIVVARHSPAQADILKISSAATKYCYSLMNTYSKHGGMNLLRGLVENHNPIVSATDEGAQKNRIRPDGFLYGFNIHFNILYDFGAHPTVQYAYKKEQLIEESREALYEKLGGHARFLNRKAEAEFKRRVDQMTKRLSDGRLVVDHTTTMSILGWNPNDIDLEV